MDSKAMQRLVVTALSCLVFSAAAQAQVPMDYDADGISDLTKILEKSDDSLTWAATLSSDSSVLALGTIGSAGDAPILAAWDSGGPQIGVVTEDKPNKALKWAILNGSSSPVWRSFGKPGDLVISGGDFNGDGKADAAVVRLVKGKATWTVSYNLFDSTGAVPDMVSFVFGETGDRVFFARVEGGSTDWIGVMRKGQGNKSNARLKNLVTGQVRQYTRLPKVASTGDRPRAFAVRQESGPDLLGFESVTKSGTLIRAYSLGGALVGSHEFLGTGQLAVGDFNDGSGFEVAFQSPKESGIFNPASGEVREKVFGAGLLVDETTVVAVGMSATPTPTPTRTPSSDGEGGNGGAGSLGCSRIIAWPGSHIYKTVGSDHFTDIRRNTIGVILKMGASGPFPSCVSAIDTRGNVVASLGLYARGAGWAARYYAGVGCGIRTALNGSAVASQARRNTGSSSIYMKFDSVCYGPIDANRCLNSSSC